MTNIQPTASITFTAPQVPAVKKDDNGICTRIKNIVVKAFNSFVYFITCHKVDWREKQVKQDTSKTTIDFMKNKHSGRANKISFSLPTYGDFYAWHETVKGKEVINIQYKADFDRKKETQKRGFELNSKGDVETIYWDNEVADKHQHNSNWMRPLLHALDTKCGKAVTKIIPKIDLQADLSKKEARLSLHTYIMSSQSLGENQYFFLDPPSSGKKTRFLPSAEYIAENQIRTLTCTGVDLDEGKPLEIKTIIGSDGEIIQQEINGKELGKDDYVPEIDIWLDIMADYLVQEGILQLPRVRTEGQYQ